MERTRLQDLVIGLVVLGVGIFGIVNALSMPEGTKPYTLVVTIIFTALGALLTGRSIYYRKTPSHDSNVVHAKEMLNPMVAFVLGVADVRLVYVVGVVVTSARLMFIMVAWMGYKKIWVMLLTIALMLGFIYALFVWQLHVMLPSGFLF